MNGDQALTTCQDVPRQSCGKEDAVTAAEAVSTIT